MTICLLLIFYIIDENDLLMKKKSRKKIGRPSIEEITYCVEILDWDMDYFFSIDVGRRVTDGPYWEHTSFKVNGKVVHPEKLSEKDIEVTILGDRRESHIVQKPEEYPDFQPKAVGRLTIRGKQREYLGSIPFDALNNIILLLQANKLKFIILSGPQLYRGTSSIRSIRFSKDFTREDWE